MQFESLNTFSCIQLVSDKLIKQSSCKMQFKLKYYKLKRLLITWTMNYITWTSEYKCFNNLYWLSVITATYKI